MDKQDYAKSVPAAEYPQCSVSRLITESEGSYAAALGIKLTDLNKDEIFKWFVAALLYGAPISVKIADRTWHVFEYNNLLTPQHILGAGWHKLVEILDQGGYSRYDHKTATKLLDTCLALLANYHGDFNCLHAAAADPADLERRIKDLGKGVGNVTMCIFLRELRGKWAKATPPLSLPALIAAQTLGYLPAKITSNHEALKRLQHLWLSCGMSIENFPEFETALVRMGLRLRSTKQVSRNALCE